MNRRPQRLADTATVRTDGSARHSPERTHRLRISTEYLLSASHQQCELEQRDEPVDARRHSKRHIDELWARRVTPALRATHADEPVLDWMDPENFNPGYLMRSMHLLPKRLNKAEWQHSQDYWVEKDSLPAAELDDGCLVYE